MGELILKRLLFLLMAALLLAGCGNDEPKATEEPKKETKTEKPAEKKPVVKEEKPSTPQEEVEAALKENKSADFIVARGQFFEEPYSVQVEYLGKENLSSKMTTKGMKLAIRDALYTVKKLDINISDIGISVKYPLVDQQGNKTDEYVIKSDFSSDTINKLTEKKSEFNADNLPDIADSWWEHNAIK